MDNDEAKESGMKTENVVGIAIVAFLAGVFIAVLIFIPMRTDVNCARMGFSGYADFGCYVTCDQPEAKISSVTVARKNIPGTEIKGLCK